MTFRPLLAISLTLVTCVAFGADNMCPKPALLERDDDDLRFTEDNFTFQQYQKSLSYLRVELPKRLQALPPGKGVDTIEGFWISYFNSLTFVEGYTLKSAALLERAKHPGVVGGPEEKHFCAWLMKREYVD